MRIIAGSARGRTLQSPKTREIRPTRDRVRESIFSILGPVDEMVVLDGFAGSGALGLEALSRGARKAYFFDPSREAIETIRENIERVRVPDRALVKRCRFHQGIESSIDEPCDLVFLDPPYGKELGQAALEALLRAPETLSQHALIVWEMGSDEEAQPPRGFQCVDERIYGSSRILFLRPVAAEEEIS